MIADKTGDTHPKARICTSKGCTDEAEVNRKKCKKCLEYARNYARESRELQKPPTLPGHTPGRKESKAFKLPAAKYNRRGLPEPPPAWVGLPRCPRPKCKNPGRRMGDGSCWMHSAMDYEKERGR